MDTTQGRGEEREKEGGKIRQMGIKDHFSRHLSKCWGGEREEEEIFLGRHSRDIPYKHPRCNRGKRWEDGGQTCVWFFGWERHHEHHNTTASAAFSQAHSHTGNKALHSLPNPNAFLPLGQRHAHSGNMCSTIYWQTTNQNNPNGPMQQAGRRRKQRRQHRLMHIWHKVRLNTEQNTSHFKNKVVGATSQKMAAIFHSTMHWRLSECVEWESFLSGFNMFRCVSLNSQSKQEERNTFSPLQLIWLHLHLTESKRNTVMGEFSDKCNFPPLLVPHIFKSI